MNRIDMSLCHICLIVKNVNNQVLVTIHRWWYNYMYILAILSNLFLGGTPIVCVPGQCTLNNILYNFKYLHCNAVWMNSLLVKPLLNGRNFFFWFEFQLWKGVYVSETGIAQKRKINTRSLISKPSVARATLQYFISGNIKW